MSTLSKLRKWAWFGVALLPLGDYAAGQVCETIVFRSGQVNGAPGNPGQLDTTVRRHPTTVNVGPLSVNPFDNLNWFTPAQSGPQAVVVPQFPGWIAGLACDSEARWINRANPQSGGNSGSVLYAIPFTVQSACIGGATLTLCYACDDILGDAPSGANPVGAYINGSPTAPVISGGTYSSQNLQVRTITGLVNPGQNYLYLYQRNNGASASGIIFSAQIDIDCCAEECVSGECCGETPLFTGMVGPVSVTTTLNLSPNGSQVQITDLSNDTTAPLGADWSTATPPAGMMVSPPASLPANEWSRSRIGTVFGVALDNNGNIYAAHSSVYGHGGIPAADAIGSLGAAGSIYRIDSLTGAASLFVTLPNTQDPAIIAAGAFASEAWPGIGNIAIDCGTQNLYASNLDDGRIYRLPLAGSPSLGSTFKHGGIISPGIAADPSDPVGFAPLGERIWAVEPHNGRLYYSIWGADSARPGGSNTVWSVRLDVNGDFIPGTDRQETIPGFPSQCPNPIADITFSPRGTMLLAQRTMGDPTPVLANTRSSAHASCIMELICESPTGLWVPSPNTFIVGNIGGTAVPSSAGGIDCDYRPGGRVWATGDALDLSSVAVYGLQGLPATGNNATIGFSLSILIDLDQDTGSTDKTQIGSVEVACPNDHCVFPPKNMVAWLPFDEPSGGPGSITNNVMSATEDGTLGPNGNYLGTPGQVGRAICFDDGYVDVPFYYPAFGLANEFTVDAWIRPFGGGPTQQTLIDKRRKINNDFGSPWSGFRLMLETAPAVLALEVSGGGTCVERFTIPFVPTITSWDYISVSYNRVGSVCLFNVNGTCFTPTLTGGPCNFSSIYAAAPMRAGDALFSDDIFGSYWYGGCMDELEVFGRAMTCGEMLEIYRGGDLGKCKEFCAVDTVKAFCGNQSSVQVPIRLCNSTNGPQTYSLSFSQTVACGNVGWSSLPSNLVTNPPGPFYTVGNGGCSIVWVTIPRPAFTTIGDIACFDVCMTNISTGFTECCTGSVTLSGGVIIAGICMNNTIVRDPVVGPGGPIAVQVADWDLVSYGGPDDRNFMIVVQDHHGDADAGSVSLNGLPPGEPVIGTLHFDGGGNATVSTSVEFVRAEPMQPYSLVLYADADGDGDLELVDSVALADRLAEDMPNGCAGTQVNDNMEIYPLGPACGFGVWEEWSGSVDVCGAISSEQAFSGMRSLKIVGSAGGSSGQGDDTVLPLNINGGHHVLEAMTYVPAGAAGTGWIVLLNTYPAPFNWSLDLQFDAGANVVRDSTQPANSTPLIRGAWVPIVIDIDLDADLVNVSYNGIQFVTGKSWINGDSGNGQPRIQALDLYAGEPGQGGTTGMYFDDIVIREVCSTTPPCPGDLNADGQVDLADLTRLLSNFGTASGASASQGDMDADGDVDLADLTAFLSRFGVIC